MTPASLFTVSCAFMAVCVGVFDMPQGAHGELFLELASPNEVTLGNLYVSASGAGAVDGYSSDDEIMGAIGGDPVPSPIGSGRAYVFSGLSCNPIRRFRSPNEEHLGSVGYSVPYRETLTCRKICLLGACAIIDRTAQRVADDDHLSSI